MAEVEIIVLPDGGIMLPRDKKESNDLLVDVFSGLSNPESLSAFFQMTEDSEIIFGKEHLCG